MAVASAQDGRTLGRYRIERELGRGGMGVVYLATDTALGKRVALKTEMVVGSAGSRGEQRRRRFVREVKALSQVNHPNVVHVFDAGEADDPQFGWVLYYTMEHVPGITLAELVHKRGPLDPGAAAAVCTQVAHGLGAAHAAGIVHRDVKPANVFIDEDGRVLIGDFGICKMEGSTAITRREQMVGTPNYLAPEQIIGDEVTPATDVFSLGALFYIIVTGEALRPQTDPQSLLKDAQSDSPRNKILAQKHLPRGLRKVVARALERDPSKRFADGEELADALADHATRVPSLAFLHEPPAPPAEPEADLEQISDDDFEGVKTEDNIPAGLGRAENTEDGDVVEAELGPVSMPKHPPAGARPMTSREPTGFDDEPELEPIGIADGSIPVARAEATAMFNMRMLEEERRRLVSAGALPEVAAPATAPRGLVPSTPPSSSPAPASALPAGFSLDHAPARSAPGSDLDAFGDGAMVDEPDLFATPTEVLERPQLVREPLKEKAAPAEAAKPRRELSLPRIPRRLFPVVAGGGAAMLAAVVVLALGRGPSEGAPVKSSSESPPVASEATSPDRTGDDGAGGKNVKPTEPTPTPDGASATSSTRVAEAELPERCRAPAPDAKEKARALRLLERGKTADREFKRKEAVLLVEEALALNPRLASAHYLHARLLAGELGRPAEAREAYRCVVALAPGSSEAAAAARVLARTGG